MYGEESRSSRFGSNKKDLLFFLFCFVLFLVCFLVVLKLKCIFPTQGRELSGPLGNESVDFTHREIDFQII